MDVAYRLGVDLGVTRTTAAVWTDGAEAPTLLELGDAAPEMPSLVFRSAEGALLVGYEAHPPIKAPIAV